MDVKQRGLFVLFTSFLLNLMLLFSLATAEPAVNLNFVVPASIRTIHIGEVREILMIARAKPDLQFSWEINGPGEFDGETDKPVILYIPPDSIEGGSTEITITATVTDDQGETARDRVTFTLLAPPATAIPTPSPTPVAQITSPTPTPTPLPTPTPTPTPQPTPVPIRIRQVVLREQKEDGTLISPTYFVDPGGIVSITVDVRVPLNMEIESTAVFGTVKSGQHPQELIYTAPEEPGGGDFVTVRVMGKDTDKILDQKMINITIRDAAQKK